MSEAETSGPDGTEAGSEGDDRIPQASVAVPSDRQELDLSGAGVMAIVLGAAFVVAAVVFIAAPNLAPTFDLTFALELVMALVAVGGGLNVAVKYLRGERNAVDPPLVEYRSTVSIPGEDLDASLLGIGPGGTSGSYTSLKAVRDRLRALVETTLVQTGVSDEDVEAAIEDGSWTEDPIAASLFSTAQPFSAVDRLQFRFGRRQPRTVQARHVVDAVADRLGIDDRGWTDPNEPGDRSTVEDGWVGRLDAVERRDRETRRWRLVGAMTLVSVGVGVVVRTPSLVLAGIAGTGLVAYQYLGSAPTPQLAVERTLDVDDPDPGDDVRVTVSVTNVGDDMVFDCRLIDGVPPGLRVVDGSPRHGTTLQPGAEAHFAYVVEADRGEHVFETPLVVSRDASGGIERTATVEADGAQFLRCEPRPTSELTVPVRSKTSRDVGRVVTDTGGSGLEFHSVREYRSGDPLKRIDWNRAARGGELATLQFREEHAATVVLLIDARTEAFVAPERDAPSALERSLGAAAEVFVSRLDSDDRVGLAALAAGDCWLAPGAGHGHWPLARELLTTNSAFTEVGGEDKRFYPILAIRQLRKKLPRNAQLVLFSPLCDDTAVWMARRLHAYGYPMTVVSPDATTTTAPGRTVAHAERQLRLSKLRQADVRVIDWHRDEPLETATDRATRRWSR
ncbi:MAG: DUF58 domain-containing protein [Halapricum sp.]